MARECGGRALLIVSLLLIFVLTLLELSSTATTTTGSQKQQQKQQQPPFSWSNNNNNNKTFAHLHFAKTGGTEINGELAARFERVCGHKGYSYDAYQFNERTRQQQEKNGNRGIFNVGNNDSIKQLYRRFNRGRVPAEIMHEIGYENCDYLSLEQPWRDWVVPPVSDIPTMIELHVPCRDPVQHLMSGCNFRGKTFNCSGNDDDVLKQIDACVGKFQRRFNQTLDDNPQHLSLKCFNPIPIEPYVQYMSERLQHKRIPARYVHRTTNKPRNKKNECIWNNATFAAHVKQLLIRNYPYFQWCHECLGSDRDLLTGKERSAGES